MEKETNIIDKLVEKECYIIDFLPKKVPQNANGQFFDVEYYWLNNDKHFAYKDKFVGIILKLMCYYHVSVLWDGWRDRPSPELIDKAVSDIMDNHSGTLNVLCPEENALLIFDWDCLNLTLYNPSIKMQSLIEQIAFSEGLFWRKSEM